MFHKPGELTVQREREAKRFIGLARRADSSLAISGRALTIDPKINTQPSQVIADEYQKTIPTSCPECIIAHQLLAHICLHYRIACLRPFFVQATIHHKQCLFLPTFARFEAHSCGYVHRIVPISLRIIEILDFHF